MMDLKKNNRNPNAGFQGMTFPAFMPGQQGLLAQQLNQGFGGGMGQWNGLLSQTTAPVTTNAWKPNGGKGNGVKKPVGDDWSAHGDVIHRFVNDRNPEIINSTAFLGLDKGLQDYIIKLRNQNVYQR